jgi:carbon storage regulator
VACDTLLEYLIGRRDSRAIERMLLHHSQAGQGLAANQEQSMIVIPRKVGESIVIWDNITVTIIEIRGDEVRLGIEHPTDVPVHRQEVFDAIRRAKAESVRPG